MKAATPVLRMLCLVALFCASDQVAGIPPEIEALEEARIAVVEQVSKFTIAVFDSKGQGGGSGVIISPEGFALTNFHVTAPCGAAMKCGLNDGKLYDAVIVGLDPPGDIAVIKLLGRTDFPAVELGDSDASRVGDSVLVAGNPFLLAEDYHPTISYGILSGTHRYQYPSGTLLEYADCLQTDAAINPGNSGGPLFDAQGRLIGINGRGSFEKRGRVNVGVGYAISVNQIKHFLTHLKAGRVVDHATLGATVASSDNGQVIVDDVLEESSAYRRGLRYGDHLASFAGRDVTTANSLKNILGTFPATWPVPIEYVRDGETFRTRVELATLHGEGELTALIEEQAEQPAPIEPPGPDDKPGEKPKDRPKSPLPDILAGKKKPELPEAIKQVYEQRDGFANYWFNRREQERIANACPQWNAIAKDAGVTVTGMDSLDHEIHFESTATEASFRSVRGQFFAKLDDRNTVDDGPPGSGGLMAAIDAWRRLVSQGYEGFDEAYYFGQLPFGQSQQLHDVVLATSHGYTTRFYFDPQSLHLIGLEHFTADDRDPCLVLFNDFRPWESGELPFMWVCRFGDNAYAEFKVEHYATTTPENGGKATDAEQKESDAKETEEPKDE